jgi:metallophosphoesterase superfamily enzyme
MVEWNWHGLNATVVGFRFDSAADGLEIVGHHHPSFLWEDGAGTRLKVPALVAGPRRLILPAFSPWAAGTPWNDRLLPAETLWAVTPKRVFAVKFWSPSEKNPP